VEFAIIAPVLLLLILGIIDFGNLCYQNHMVNEAARAGARYATVDSNLASIPADVTNYINNNYDNNLTIHVSPSPPVSLQNVTVQVTNRMLKNPFLKNPKKSLSLCA
jgi:Flp pilus assembly protein TadG